MYQIDQCPWKQQSKAGITIATKSMLNMQTVQKHTHALCCTVLGTRRLCHKNIALLVLLQMARCYLQLLLQLMDQWLKQESISYYLSTSWSSIHRSFPKRKVSIQLSMQASINSKHHVSAAKLANRTVSGSTLSLGRHIIDFPAGGSIYSTIRLLGFLQFTWLP